MLWFFFDTSAIVKRFHKEKGTEIVDKIVNSLLEGKHKGTVTPLVVLEFISASRRKVGSGEISWKKFKDGVASFLEESAGNFSFMSIESGTYTEAADYVIKYGLSASDSIHLVSISKISQTVDKSKLILVSADARLCDSAEQEGFRTLNPEHITDKKIEEVLAE
jgi:predicted nucleic acid-binding protein